VHDPANRRHYYHPDIAIVNFDRLFPALVFYLADPHPGAGR
jgi:hypothetical protein